MELTLFLTKILAQALQHGAQIRGADVAAVMLVENVESVAQFLLLFLCRVALLGRTHIGQDSHKLLETHVAITWGRENKRL